MSDHQSHQDLPREGFITCDNLVKIYKVEDIEVVALQGLDLTIDRGELMAIIGPSGSGKSTLMNVLGGLDSPSAGKALVAGIDLIRMTEPKRRRYRRSMVGFVWQNVGRNLVPYLSALENVQLPMILAGSFRFDRARMLLELVGLGHRMHHLPQHMSGGEQQRVAVAIALANNPPVLLADEPTGSLDSENAAKLVQAFDAVRRQLDVTVVIVTHDTSMAKQVDRYVEIRNGKTSRESVRIVRSSAYDGHVEEHHDAHDQHEHYTLLDSAGRLQLPEDLLQSYGIRKRVKLVEEDGRIILTAPDDQEAQEGTS